MATTAQAYRNSDAAKSAKTRDFLSRSDIAEMLDAADFSREIEAIIIRREGREKGSRNYRRQHLVAALKGIWRAAGCPYGKNEILVFASVEGYAIEAGTSERAMRYKLRELESPEIGVLQLVHPANSVRRPATYRLNLSALRRRRTYQDVKNSRPAPTPIRPRRGSHHSPPAAQAAAPHTTQPPTAAPVPVASRDHRDTRRPPRQLSAREGATLVAKMIELMRGVTGLTELSGYFIDYLRDPDHPDPRYRAPMSQEKSLIAASMTLGIPHDAAQEHLRLCCWKFNESEPSP